MNLEEYIYYSKLNFADLLETYQIKNQSRINRKGRKDNRPKIPLCRTKTRKIRQIRGSYIGEIEDGLPHGLGTMKINNNYYVYIGQWKKGLKDGIGLVKSGDNIIYQGEFKNNKCHGYGYYNSPDGTIYEGQFANDREDGIGIALNKNGDIFKGEFRQGSFVFGYIQYKDGKKYEGQLKHSVHNGYGICTFSNGDIYEGEFMAGNMSGAGMMRYNKNGNFFRGISNCGVQVKGIYKLKLNGESYLGEMVNRIKNGFGVCKYPNGSIYKGQWKDGEFDGYGIFIQKTDIYKGEFKKGEACGYGLIKDCLGDIKESIVNKGVGYGICIYKKADGAIFEGEMKDGKPDGVGTYIYPTNDDCDVYEGEWKTDEKLTSLGICKYRNGDIYKGEWLKEKRHGFGTIIYNDGFIYEGNWLENNRHGLGVLIMNDGRTIHGNFKNNEIEY